MTEPTEEKPEQKQTTTKDAIKIMLKAFELAENANGYKESAKGHINIFVNDGKDKTNDPTLAAYIKKAEQAFIQENATEILDNAESLLKNEIAEIREMLG